LVQITQAVLIYQSSTSAIVALQLRS